MPSGELYIKTVSTNGWVDAYTTYGVSMSDKGMSQLMTPAANKHPVVNKNILSHGESVVQSTFVKDVRQVSLEMHLVGSSRSDFLTKYSNFCSQVLDAGYIMMKTRYLPSVMYQFLYLDCTQFTETRLEMANFTLSLEEPNPTIRAIDSDWIYDDSSEEEPTEPEEPVSVE